MASISVYYNGSNKTPTRKSFKGRIDELISVEDTSSKLSDLTIRFDDFLRRYEILHSELTVSKNLNRLLTERIVQLEGNAVSNVQYHRDESPEINPVSACIGDDVLESSIFTTLSVIGHEVKPDDLQAYHSLKKKDTVIVKFKCRKQKRSILINKKNLRNKSDVLTQLNFSGRLFVSKSMCHKNHQLSDKCRQLKNAGKIYSTWFWNNSVNVKLNERSQPTKIHHVIDIENLLELTIEFINNICF